MILIDAECILCNRFARFVLRNDEKWIFSFAAQDGAWARDAGLAPGCGSAGDSILLWRQEGVLSGSDAVLWILSRLRGPWSIAGVLRFIPRFLRDAVYSFVAGHRYRWFGRVEACALLNPEEKARFLDGPWV